MSTVVAKHCALRLLVGCIVIALPWLVSRLNIEQLWPINFLLAPAGIVALILSGNVHIYSLIVTIVANVALLAAAAYLVMKALGK